MIKEKLELEKVINAEIEHAGEQKDYFKKAEQEACARSGPAGATGLYGSIMFYHHVSSALSKFEVKYASQKQLDGINPLVNVKENRGWGDITDFGLFYNRDESKIDYKKK
jgi:hypothetical protein